MPGSRPGDGGGRTVTDGVVARVKTVTGDDKPSSGQTAAPLLHRFYTNFGRPSVFPVIARSRSPNTDLQLYHRRFRHTSLVQARREVAFGVSRNDADGGAFRARRTW